MAFVVNTGRWESGLIYTDPADGQVLVDSGSLEAGSYLIGGMGAGSAAWVYDIQHRNAANTATLDSQRRRPAAGNEDFLLPNKIPVGPGERVRLVLVGAVTGQIQMSLVLQTVYSG
jgi:hypothetical protein